MVVIDGIVDIERCVGVGVVGAFEWGDRLRANGSGSDSNDVFGDCKRIDGDGIDGDGNSACVVCFAGVWRFGGFAAGWLVCVSLDGIATDGTIRTVGIGGAGGIGIVRNVGCGGGGGDAIVAATTIGARIGSITVVTDDAGRTFFDAALDAAGDGIGDVDGVVADVGNVSKNGTPSFSVSLPVSMAMQSLSLRGRRFALGDGVCGGWAGEICGGGGCGGSSSDVVGTGMWMEDVDGAAVMDSNSGAEMDVVDGGGEVLH